MPTIAPSVSPERTPWVSVLDSFLDSSAVHHRSHGQAACPCDLRSKGIPFARIASLQEFCIPQIGDRERSSGCVHPESTPPTGCRCPTLAVLLSEQRTRGCPALPAQLFFAARLGRQGFPSAPTKTPAKIFIYLLQQTSPRLIQEGTRRFCRPLLDFPHRLKLGASGLGSLFASTGRYRSQRPATKTSPQHRPNIERTSSP